MKTLIINGSPRPNGNTAALIEQAAKNLNGEIKTINAYHSNISPCTDCRFCKKNKGCIIKDDMQQIYSYIEDCDNIIIASPVYFGELTGRLLDVCSRFQTYFSAMHFRGEKPEIKPKKAAVILTGGGSGTPKRAYDTAALILRHLSADNIHPLVCSFNTDKLPASEDISALNAALEIAEFFNNADLT